MSRTLLVKEAKARRIALVSTCFMVVLMLTLALLFWPKHTTTTITKHDPPIIKTIPGPTTIVRVPASNAPHMAATPAVKPANTVSATTTTTSKLRGTATTTAPNKPNATTSGPGSTTKPDEQEQQPCTICITLPTVPKLPDATPITLPHIAFKP